MSSVRVKTKDGWQRVPLLGSYAALQKANEAAIEAEAAADKAKETLDRLDQEQAIIKGLDVDDEGYIVM